MGGGGDRHRLRRDGRADVIAGDEDFDHVEIGFCHAVHLGDAPALDADAWARIVRALEGGEAVLGDLHGDL
jgi:hypothetical protein